MEDGGRLKVTLKQSMGCWFLFGKFKTKFKTMVKPNQKLVLGLMIYIHLLMCMLPLTFCTRDTLT